VIFSAAGESLFRPKAAAMNEKLKSILKGAAVAAVGAMLTYATQAIPALSVPPVLVPAVTAILSILANAIRKTPLFDPKPAPGPAPSPPDVSPNKKPTDWLDAIRHLLGDALRDAVVGGDSAKRDKVMSLLSEVEDAA
jgi:hypothetical protein